MTIKEVSEKYNISQDTLRYYEKVGIIRPVTRKNGIRNYGEQEIANIEFVVCMRGAGLSIDVLVEYLKLYDQGDETQAARRQLLIDEREKLKAKIEQMNAALEKLNYKIDVYYKEIVEKEKVMLNKKGE
ncbi:MAG: MerR family transcriptional regulator [Clostridia bacterium]|nr:MerR family transcriptional regulator [Clostridia bacterium]MDE7329385.1 MerR family transcriptional regulator [Clostridia bacterium]